jgi:hypothetical protein
VVALRTIALLGNPYGWYARDLARAAKLRGIELLPVSFEHLETSLSDARSTGPVHPAASSRSTPGLDRQIPLDPRVPGCPDLLLVRSMPMGSLEQVILYLRFQFWEHWRNQLLRVHVVQRVCWIKRRWLEMLPGQLD